MDDLAAEIKIRLENVKAKIADAAKESGRKPAEVKVVVVTKAQPLNVVEAAIRAGAFALGENYAEEAVEKIEHFMPTATVEWHMIGHIQSRKAKKIAPYFHMVHSIDRVSLALKLNQALLECNRRIPVLLEINVGKEESKFGWAAGSRQEWDTVLPDIEAILQLEQLNVVGLMTMPPIFDQPDTVRPLFARLRSLLDDLQSRYPDHDWQHLSMGTSGDYEAAVREGATLVRIGTAIVGPRLLI